MVAFKKATAKKVSETFEKLGNFRESFIKAKLFLKINNNNSLK
jgi:hypothetical protein